MINQALPIVLFLDLALVGLSNAAGIQVNGEFDDWYGKAPIVVDATGDGSPGGVDFGAIMVESNAKEVFLFFEVGRETLLQSTSPDLNGNNVRLLIDGDANASTGVAEQGIGAEVVIDFGERNVRIAGTNPTYAQAGIQSGPTHTSDRFELRIPRTAPGDGSHVAWIGADTIRLVMVDASSGDRLPDRGFIAVPLGSAPAPEISPIALERAPDANIRIYNHNTEHGGLVLRPDPYKRLLTATRPDILTIQELWQEPGPSGTSVSDQQIGAFLAANYPHPDGGAWHVKRHYGCTTISRWPFSAVHELPRTLVTRIDIPNAISSADLVIFNAHTPCCDHGNPGRDKQHDQIAATWRDIMGGSGPFEVAAGTPALMTGDFNMVGWKRQLLALRDGDLHNNAQWGADFAPDWGAGPMRAVPFRHTHSNAAFTWREMGSSYAPGRLDWMFYTPGALDLKKAFILSTDEMPADALAAAGLKKTDSSTAADHLSMVADFDLP